MTDQPSKTADGDREDEELADEETEEEEEVEEEFLTERQILERKAAEARRLYPHLISCHEFKLWELDHPEEMREFRNYGKRKPRERDLFSDLEDDPLPNARQANDESDDDDDDDDDDANDELS